MLDRCSGITCFCAIQSTCVLSACSLGADDARAFDFPHACGPGVCRISLVSARSSV